MVESSPSSVVWLLSLCEDICGYISSMHFPTLPHFPNMPWILWFWAGG